MKLSELIILLTGMLAMDGDMNAYVGDMKPMDDAIIEVVSGNDVYQPEKYGAKFLNITHD